MDISKFEDKLNCRDLPPIDVGDTVYLKTTTHPPYMISAIVTKKTKNEITAKVRLRRDYDTGLIADGNSDTAIGEKWVKDIEDKVLAFDISKVQEVSKNN